MSYDLIYTEFRAKAKDVFASKCNELVAKICSL